MDDGVKLLCVKVDLLVLKLLYVFGKEGVELKYVVIVLVNLMYDLEVIVKVVNKGVVEWVMDGFRDGDGVSVDFLLFILVNVMMVESGVYVIS